MDPGTVITGCVDDKPCLVSMGSNGKYFYTASDDDDDVNDDIALSIE
jgi:hypothetical protein